MATQHMGLGMVLRGMQVDLLQQDIFRAGISCRISFCQGEDQVHWQIYWERGKIGSVGGVKKVKSV